MRVPPMDSAHELTHLRVRRGSDRTRIQDCHRAFFHARDFLEPGLKQLLLQCGAVCLASATAKIEDVKRCHAQRRIVAEVWVGRQRHFTASLSGRKRRSRAQTGPLECEWERLSRGSCSPALLKALPTIYGPALSRLKGHCRLLTTLRARGGSFDALVALAAHHLTPF